MRVRLSTVVEAAFLTKEGSCSYMLQSVTLEVLVMVLADVMVGKCASPGTVASQYKHPSSPTSSRHNMFIAL